MGKLLNNDDKLKCLKLWREYHDEEAITILIESNMGLVKSIANKYKGTPLTYDELVSAGRIGLFNAINKFDYINRPIEGFNSYIGISIENGILQDLRKYNKHSHVMSFNQTIGHNKDDEELKLEDVIGTDADELIDNVITEFKNEALREALQCLTSREKQIMFLRYGLDEDSRKTQEEIAQIYNCTKSNISRMENKALIKMRHPKNTRKIKDFLD